LASTLLVPYSNEALLNKKKLKSLTLNPAIVIVSSSLELSSILASDKTFYVSFWLETDSSAISSVGTSTIGLLGDTSSV